jgi:hypothetical protein
MYPRAELTELAARRAALQTRIAARRALTATVAARVIRPLAKFDQLHARWRKVSPVLKIAAVPLAFVLKQRFFPGVSLWRSMLRWSPLMLGMMRRMSRARV